MHSLVHRSRLLLGLLLLTPLVLAGCGPNLIDRIRAPYWGLCGTVIIVLDVVALFDLLTDERREAGSKIIWTLIILFMPVLGCILYYLIGRD